MTGRVAAFSNAKEEPDFQRSLYLQAGGPAACAYCGSPSGKLVLCGRCFSVQWRELKRLRAMPFERNPIMSALDLIQRWQRGEC